MCPVWLSNPDKKDPALDTEPGPLLPHPTPCGQVSDGPRGRMDKPLQPSRMGLAKDTEIPVQTASSLLVEGGAVFDS